MRIWHTVICAAAVLGGCADGLAVGQRTAAGEIAARISNSPPRSVEETRLFRRLAVVLNDRTALEAMLTDPDSASYKEGLISLAQAAKMYAWLGRDDIAFLAAMQMVANRLRALLT
ncbi:hypothetical protein IWQ56_002134 [Coemansia nantahalensis]|uniref:Uncharacterized protein n=1 Tax=Coemansia nantahalensis TaxID=2789366 RepID=A0ACC1JNN4_9FUNG|nr:hypothetical protein IWQ57_005324 [Coemansia nantahalensis]KAJ2770515.1 hypothetical protein IWQ56_002134 [Coemansia nantahalensis]